MPIRYKVIGRNIRDQRKKRKLTQQQLAEDLGCSTEHLSHIENGVRHIQFEMLNSACIHLQVSFEDLLCGAMDVPVRSDQAQDTVDRRVREFADIVANCSTESVDQILEICRRIVDMSK